MARRKKQTQTQIPGTERKGVPELDEIAAPYVEELYQALESHKAAGELRAQLIARMVHLERAKYVFSDGEYDYEFEAESKTKLKTKRRRVGSEDEGEAAPDGDEG